MIDEPQERKSSPAPRAADGTAPGRFLKRLRVPLLLFVAAAVVLVGLYFFAATRWSYSSGERAGYVQKFSKKGWLCKTWEGEVAMANLPGAMPEIFSFTVRDDAVAAEINRQLGMRVVLSYEQHLGLPACFGETQYWVTKVRRVEL